ncbi:MAG: hypothetical protein WC492_04335 [Candidatus Micrarchaeia archaeon]
MMSFDPVVIAGNFTSAFNAVATETVLFVPNVIEAIILLVLGYFVSEIIGKIVSNVLEYLKVEKILQKYRVEDALGGNEISPLFAIAAKWYVMLLFLTAAFDVLQLSSINWFIDSILLYAPVLLGVGLLVLVSALIGEWVREAVLDLHKFYMQKTLAELLKWFIVCLSVVVGLETMGFQMVFVREVFTTILQGLVYGVAIAFGLAFGLGGQKDAQDLIRKSRKALKF